MAIEEKPRLPKSEFAVAGIYIYDHHIFEAVNNIEPSQRGELEISDAHQYLIDHGYQVGYSEITGWWKDTGKPIDLLEANRLVLEHLEPRIEGIVDEKSYTTGNVIIEKGVMGKNDTLIEGKNSVTICFAQDAIVKTEGTIYVQKYLLHCQAFCESLEEQGPQVSIVGGMVKAEKSVIVKQTGSENGVATKVVIFDKNKSLFSAKAKELKELRDKLFVEIEPIERQLKNEDPKIVKFYPKVKVKEVPEAQLRSVDPHLISFHNINTPEDFAASEKILMGRG